MKRTRKLAVVALVAGLVIATKRRSRNEVQDS